MERRGFLKMLGFGAAAAIPGATLFGNEVLDEAAEKAGVSQETIASIKKLDPPSETDALIAEHWAKESLNILHENMTVSNLIHRENIGNDPNEEFENYLAFHQGDVPLVTGDELKLYITTEPKVTQEVCFDVVATCTVTGVSMETPIIREGMFYRYATKNELRRID